MTFRAKSIGSHVRHPYSWFQIERGKPFDGTFEISDRTTRQLVHWEGHRSRLRIYSQFVDDLVLLEVEDRSRCYFSSDGLWHLRLTEQETSSLPVGGMRFTLEHCQIPAGSAHQDVQNADLTPCEFRLGLLGGISCRNPKRSRRLAAELTPTGRH
jgi:hypothetical protein